MEQASRKTKAIEVTLSDGSVVFVHAPKTKDLPLFINSLSALNAMSKAFEASSQTDIIGLNVSIDPLVMDNLYPLLASMSDMSVDELKELELWDGIAVFAALNQFAPKNSVAPTERG